MGEKWIFYLISLGAFLLTGVIIGASLFSFGGTISFGNQDSLGGYGLHYYQDYTRYSVNFSTSDRSSMAGYAFGLIFYSHNVQDFDSAFCNNLYGVSKTSGECQRASQGTYCGSSTTWHCSMTCGGDHACAAARNAFYDWLDLCRSCTQYYSSGSRPIPGCVVGNVIETKTLYYCNFNEENVLKQWVLDPGASYYEYTVKGRKEISLEQVPLYDEVISEGDDFAVQCEEHGYGRLRKEISAMQDVRLYMEPVDLKGCEGDMSVSVVLNGHHPSVGDLPAVSLPESTSLGQQPKVVSPVVVIDDVKPLVLDEDEDIVVLGKEESVVGSSRGWLDNVMAGIAGFFSRIIWTW